MIFSGQVRDYKCPACGYETQAQYSTVIPYWIVLIAISCGVLFPIIRHRFGPHHADYALLAIIADFARLAILTPLTTKFANRRVPADLKCPRCAGPLEKSGFGFYDYALVPTLSDLLTGLLYLLAHAAALHFLLRK